MITQQFITEAINLAKKEIEIFKVPSPIHFNIALAKGKQLARQLNAREDLVALGTVFMDIKLGEAYQLNKLDQHVKMSLQYAQAICKSYPDLTIQEKDTIFNSIESHHGSILHTSLESEIVTNADCYRFIHPMGVTWWNAALGKSTDNFQTILTQLNSKLEEKWKLVSLPIVINELEPYYIQYKELFKVAGKNF